MMTITTGKLPQNRVEELLRECNNSFSPPLECNIPYTLDEYAAKLSRFASFVLCLEDERVIGFLAYYLNNEGGFAYIPQIWVSDQYQRKGIGSSMIAALVGMIPNGVNSVRLEVRKNNPKAYAFYLKGGYTVIEERNGKFLMEKKI